MDVWSALEQLVRSVHPHYEQLQSEGKSHKIRLVKRGGGLSTVSSLFEAIEGRLHISMDNCPHQVVVVDKRGL